jgi:hypothetical protein
MRVYAREFDVLYSHSYSHDGNMVIWKFGRSNTALIRKLIF